LVIIFNLSKLNPVNQTPTQSTENIATEQDLEQTPEMETQSKEEQGLPGKKNFDIVFQTFDIQNIVEQNLNQFVFRFYENSPFSSSLRSRFVGNFKPVKGFVGCRQKIGIRNGF